MTYEEIPPLYCATWSVYEAFRRFGFSDDDVIFVSGRPALQDGFIASEPWMHVVLKAQDKEFTVTVAPLDRPYADAQVLLERLRVSIHDGTTLNDTLCRIWRESRMGEAAHFEALAAALSNHGFMLPALAN